MNCSLSERKKKEKKKFNKKPLTSNTGVGAVRNGESYFWKIIFLGRV